MKLFGTNQVLVFINLQGLREKIVVHSYSKGRVWSDQVDSRKGFKLGQSRLAFEEAHLKISWRHVEPM